MKDFLTYRVNTLRNIFIATLVIFVGAAIQKISAEPASEEIVLKFDHRNISDADKSAPNSSSEKVGRQIHFLQMDPTLVSFEFSKTKTVWLVSEAEWKNFWSTNSKITGDAPALNLNWRTEALLAVFFESKDAVVRIPSFLGTEEYSSGATKNLRVHLGLNTPCFGIITSQSPAVFLVVNKNFADLDSISFAFQNTKSTGCF